MLSAIPNLETAAHQLCAHLQALRKAEQDPIMFLGRTLGGIIVLQALTLASQQSTPGGNVLSHTAGVFSLVLSPFPNSVQGYLPISTEQSRATKSLLT
jgi:hypothetical protein